MALPLQHVLSHVATVLLFSYFTFPEVSGAAFKSEDNNLPVTDLDTGAKLTPVEGNEYRTENGTVIELFPVSTAHVQLQLDAFRRRLGEFQCCQTCKCCDSEGKSCRESMPCCFGINCNVKPYGVCKFVPLHCSCAGCGI